jgi:DNA-binding transcriptional LysR family regulator
VSFENLDLNLLRVLDSVLAERSVVRAARRLHVTPSAVSNALARLRSILADPLVVRRGRGIVPTPRAARLGPAVRRALSELEASVQAERFDPRTTTQRFALAIADVGQLVSLPQLVKSLAIEMPCAQIRVVGIDTYISSGGVAGPDIDLGVIGAEEKGPGVHVRPLYNESSVLVAGRANRHATARLSKARLAELAHVDVEVAAGRGYRELARAYARLGIERKIAAVVPGFAAAAAVVADTEFVATLPSGLFDLLGERFGLRVLSGAAPMITTEIKLVWHDRTHYDGAMRAFREIVSRALVASRRSAFSQHAADTASMPRSAR